MITFAFDRKGQHGGYVPNLVTRTDIVPKSDDWWGLCITPPFSYEFRLMRYMDAESMPYNEILVSEIDEHTTDPVYPINLNFFDPEIDYIALISDEAKQLCREDKLRILFYYSEGDNPKSHITSRLKMMTQYHDIPMSNVKFVLANKTGTSRHPYIYFPDDELYYRYLHLYEKDYVKQVNMQPRSKNFTCLNRMDKPFRKLFASSLWYHGLSDNGYFSYNSMSYDNEFDEQLRDPVYKWETYWRDVEMLFDNFDMHTPIKCDDLDDNGHNNHKLIDKKFFEDSYVNFVVETHFSKNNVFLTEKTFKPILNLQPFLIVGAPGSIALLQDLGYETFDEWWDESYDDIEDDEERMYNVFGIAYDLAQRSKEDLAIMTKEMIPVLAHNQQVLLNSKRDRIEQLIKKILK
jgi:hypothetical protein